MNSIIIKQQARKSLAMKVTPGGVEVLIPHHLDSGSERVQNFIEAGLQHLIPPPPVPAAERLTKNEVLALVKVWEQRLDVQVQRVQLQPMRNKWGSISTIGNLTLASDLLTLPRSLVEYVICHELLHLKVPNHTKLYRLLLSRYIPDWRERERELGRWALKVDTSA